MTEAARGPRSCLTLTSRVSSQTVICRRNKDTVAKPFASEDAITAIASVATARMATIGSTANI
jgi:hypothetical protein